MVKKEEDGVLLKETDREERDKVLKAAPTASKKEDRERQSERKKPRQGEFESAGHMERRSWLSARLGQPK